MKKFLSLLLVLIMFISLATCGDSTSKTTSDSQSQSKTESTETTEATETTKADSITLGSTIDLEYVNMTLDSFEISNGYSFEATDNSSGISVTTRSSIDCPADMKLICLKGKFTNKTKGDIFPANGPIYGELVVNGYTYKTEMDCYISETAESVLTLAPLRTVDYYLYAEVPVALADAVEDCTLNIGFVTDLDASKPVFEMSDNDVLYTLEAIPTTQQ